MVVDRSARMFSERKDDESDSMLYSPLKLNQSNASSYHRKKKTLEQMEEDQNLRHRRSEDYDDMYEAVNSDSMSSKVNSRNASKKQSQRSKRYSKHSEMSSSRKANATNQNFKIRNKVQLKSEVIKQKKEASTMDNSIAGPSKQKTITTKTISNNEPQVDTVTSLEMDNSHELFEIRQQPLVGFNTNNKYTYSATSFGKV